MGEVREVAHKGAIAFLMIQYQEIEQDNSNLMFNSRKNHPDLKITALAGELALSVWFRQPDR